MSAREIVSYGSDEERRDMRAHVPAIGQQRHRTRHQTHCDLEDHHHGSDADHDPRAPFRPGKIGDKVVRLPETRMIRPVHESQSTRFSIVAKIVGRFCETPWRLVQTPYNFLLL